MRAVVQRVKRASVSVGSELVSRIDGGLLVYVGVARGDDESDVAYLSRKIVGLRVFPDERKPMNRSIEEVGGEVLVVSQFTLFGDCRKGRRPSFNEAMEPEGASELVETLCRSLEASGVRTARGRFGAMMSVESVNWGPVTILLDSKKLF